MIRSNRNEAPRVETPIPTPSVNINQPPVQKTNVANPATPTAVIGPKIRFKGELVGEEDLLVQGQIDGTIDLRDNNLIVGKQGTVKANVLAKTIIIEGNVEGDIYGKEHIAIKASSNVKGNLVADRVTLEDGAKFKGSIDMEISAHKSKFDQAKTVIESTASPSSSEKSSPKVSS